MDEAEAERSRKDLLELQANSAAVESTGQAKAEAQSRAEAAKIEGEAAVEQAKLKAQAAKIQAVRMLVFHHFLFDMEKNIIVAYGQAYGVRIFQT